MSDYNAEVNRQFGDNISYFEGAGFEGLTDNVAYFLNNDEERELLANKGMELVLSNHTWRNRAEYILKSFFNIDVNQAENPVNTNSQLIDYS
jgi:spore maturation protein CgeB